MSAGLWDLALALLQGDIISCAGSYLYLWTVNGQLLASISTACSPTCHIVCCCFAEVMDWDTRSIIITGSTDGVVRVGGWERGKGTLIHCRAKVEFFCSKWRDRGTKSPRHFLHSAAEGRKWKSEWNICFLSTFILLIRGLLMIQGEFWKCAAHSGVIPKAKNSIIPQKHVWIWLLKVHSSVY